MEVVNRRKPELIAYAVKDPGGSEQKTIWTRIGAAWAHEKGPGYSIRLDALPVDGRIVLVEPADPKPGERE
jgi:hypothetical protein